MFCNSSMGILVDISKLCPKYGDVLIGIGVGSYSGFCIYRQAILKSSSKSGIY